MSPMHQPLDKASGQQARRTSRVTWCLGLLALAWLWFHLPLEAFDADADVGLDEAVLQDFGALRASPSGSTLVPESSAGPPTWRTLRPVTLAAAVPLLRASGDPVNRQLWHLRASRLCARSRIAEPPCPLQQQVRTRNLVLSSRSFTDLLAVEGGFFYEEVRERKTNANRSNGVAACGTGKGDGIAYDGSASVVFIEEDQLFAPRWTDQVKSTRVLKNVSPEARFGSSAGHRVCA